MRASLLILAVSCCMLHAGDADPTIQRIAEAAQGLIRAQREDGSWPEPRAHELGLTWLPPPPEAGRESNQPAPEHRYRSAAPSLGFAAEALWRARTWVPDASAAAARAHLLAAKALLADPHRPVTLDESVSFLLADTARGVPDANPIVTATVQACRLRLDQGIRHGSTGDTFLGLINPESPRHIDLMRTFVASDLLPPSRREWLGDAGTKVARFQTLFPSVVTNGTTPPSGVEFEDGTAFAVGLLAQPGDAAMELLRSAYADRSLADMELTRALACMRAFARRVQDPPTVWWRTVADRWTNELIAMARRIDDQSGVRLEWIDRRISIDIFNGMALHWLILSQQIRAGSEQYMDAVRRAKENRVASEKWQEERVSNALRKLSAMQNPDGSWGGTNESAEATPLAILGFLGVGYDHKTQNPYSQTLKRGVHRLVELRSNPVPTRAIALRTMALCEAYAMTSDTTLQESCQQGIALLVADRTADGGWSHPSTPGRRHWPTTTLAIMALKSAHAAGLATPIKELGVWWPGVVGDVKADSLEDISWKSAAGVFLGLKAHAETALMAALLERTGKTLPDDPWIHYASTLAVFQSGGAAWKSWMERSMIRPMPPPTTPLAELSATLLADAVVQRYLQVQSVTP